MKGGEGGVPPAKVVMAPCGEPVCRWPLSQHSPGGFAAICDAGCPDWLVWWACPAPVLACGELILMARLVVLCGDVWRYSRHSRHDAGGGVKLGREDEAEEDEAEEGRYAYESGLAPALGSG